VTLEIWRGDLEEIAKNEEGKNRFPPSREADHFRKGKGGISSTIERQRIRREGWDISTEGKTECASTR